MSLEVHTSVVVVNYQTPDLLDRAVRSFCRCYPEISLLIVDNGSRDASPDVIRDLRRDLDRVTALMLDENTYHGPAMDAAIRQVESDFVFFLDSDTETLRSGFLEAMVARCEIDDVYGVGRVVHVNRRGFAARSGLPVLASAYMLIKRALYLDLPPFVHHGLPVLRNFRAAAESGYRVVDFPVDEYVDHFGRGTADRYGYGLGLKSRLDYLLHRIGL